MEYVCVSRGLEERYNRHIEIVDERIALTDAYLLIKRKIKGNIPIEVRKNLGKTLGKLYKVLKGIEKEDLALNLPNLKGLWKEQKLIKFLN